MTVDEARLEASSTLSIESVLNQMPQFVPAQDQFDAQAQIQTTATASLGVGTVDLRGIGPNRTLVLIDGRRAQPSNASLVVDLNSIAAAAIERVETITGGASAVYGADALAGVVNFVLKKDFEGVALDAQTGATAEGDAQETRVTSLIGTASDRSNVMLGVEWYKRELALQRDHEFYQKGWADPTNDLTAFFPSMPSYQVDPANRPSQAVVDSLFGPGVVDISRSADFSNRIFFNPDGTPFVIYPNRAPGFDTSLLHRPYTGDGLYGMRVNDGANQYVGQQYEDGAAATPLERRSAFGSANFAMSDHVSAFVQANFTDIQVDTYSAGPPPALGAWAACVPNDNRTAIPSALQQLLDSRAGTTAGCRTPTDYRVNRGLDFIGQFGPQNTSEVYQVLAGFKGTFENRDWTWEAYYSSGKTVSASLYPTMPSVQRYFDLMYTPNFGQGQNLPVLPPGVQPPGNYQSHCTSGLPIFYGDTSTVSADCVNAVLGRWRTQSRIDQDIFEGILQGKIIDMRSGELRFAAGVTTRDNSFSYEPLNPQGAYVDQPMGVFASNTASGETSVSEIYGELLVPLADRLNLEAGYRISDYDNLKDNVETYKLLFDWSATDSIRLRGGFQQANRAPNVAELFQADILVFDGTFSAGDPCLVTNVNSWANVPGNPNRLQVQELCAALIGNTTSTFGAPGSAEADSFGAGSAPFTGMNGIQQGNPNLESENADTWTLGVVFTAPGNLENLTASVDIYNIEITDAIETFNAQTIYTRCFNADGRTNPTYSIDDPLGYCSLIVRNPSTGGAQYVRQSFLNTGLLETTGLDIQVNWQAELANGASFFMNHFVTYLDKFDTQTSPSDVLLEYKGTLGRGGQFDYKITSTFGYNFGGGNANIGVRMRHLPEIKNAAYVTNRNTTTLPTESFTRFDLFGSYSFNERFQLRGGIDNLADELPPVVGAVPGDSNSNQTDTGWYDVLGRRAYVGLKVLF